MRNKSDSREKAGDDRNDSEAQVAVTASFSITHFIVSQEAREKELKVLIKDKLCSSILLESFSAV